MLILFVLLLSPFPTKPGVPLSVPAICNRFAWLNLRTGETGHSYCLSEPRYCESSRLMRRVPHSVSYIEEIDCSEVPGTRTCKRSDGTPLILK